MSDLQKRESVPNISTESYTVGIGDTLALVAARFDSTLTELTSINKLTSSFIYPGQQLLVPSKLDRVQEKESNEKESHGTSILTDRTREMSNDGLQVNPAATTRETISHVVVQPNFGPDPTIVTCFNCRNVVTTRAIESTNALCCFMFGCWSLFCPGCQDVEHRCPRCNVILGTYKAA